jgi:4-amino-4-deoxy-L-arabinose transferase-like glycosyltransferase
MASNNQPSKTSASFLQNFWQRTSGHITIIFLMSLPLLFWQLGSYALFDPDEGRYAEIPRELLARANWVTPTLNFVTYFEKPPLLYWMSAISFWLFGLNEWAARLTPALSAFLGLYVAYALGRRMWGARGGILSALILATSLLWTIIGREAVIDTLLSTLVFATLAFWWLAHTQAETSSERPWEKYFYDFGFWLSLALAFLAKGPVILILAGGSIFFYLLICKQWRTLKGMGWWWGVPLCALIVAPWFILVAMNNPSYNHFFWYGQNFARFLGIGKNREHVKGFFYFIELLPLVFFPWSCFVASAAFGWKKLSIWPPNTLRRRAVIFLLSCFIFITLFFSSSTSKLITYILPAIPFAAVLMGGYLDTLIRRDKTALFPRAGIWVLGVLIAIVMIAGTFVGGKELVKREAVSGYLVIAPALALLIWLIGLIWAARLQSVWKTALVTIGGFTLLWISALQIVIAIAPNHTQKVLLQYIEPGLKQGGEIVLYKDITQSVSFYTRSRVRIINGAGEISHGASLLSKTDQAYWFPTDDDAVKKILDQNKPVYVMTGDHRKSQKLIKEYNLNATELIWNKRRSIIGNAAAARITPPYGALRPKALNNQ